MQHEIFWKSNWPENIIDLKIDQIKDLFQNIFGMFVIFESSGEMVHIHI